MSTTALHNHHPHAGELEVQTLRGSPPDLAIRLPQIIEDKMPEQHSSFFQGLNYFAVSTCDEQGRPWATLLTKAPRAHLSYFILAASSSMLLIRCRLPVEDPCAPLLVGGRTWAGLGVDFTNRRRNKVAGVVKESSFSNQGDLTLAVTTNESLGNCPKYITIRELTPLSEHRPSTCEVNARDGNRLTSQELKVINKASTVYLATRHLDLQDGTKSDMGLNHRGGPPGFIRTEEEGGQTFVYLPDYSGNRFYQSLGNVQSDKLAGLLVPDFATGDMLQLTGVADNVFGVDADRIMPRVSLLTRIKVTGHVFIRQAINMQLTSKTLEQFSPYNPPVRLLRSELQKDNVMYSSPTTTNMCSLVSVTKLSDLVSTFTFQSDEGIQFLPGGNAILDFSSVLTRQYRHMNPSNPKQVNDDLIRTWTISSPPALFGDALKPTTTFSCTIKKAGLISSLLHELPGSYNLRVPLRGVGGGFSCFDTSMRCENKRMLWIAGGVGVTPFYSMLAAMENMQREKQDFDIDVCLAVKGNEVALANRFKGPPIISNVSVFSSGARNEQVEGKVKVFSRRMGPEDVRGSEGLLSRSIYVCGPTPFMSAVSAWLKEAGVSADSINQESFF
ncbi:hypothetical protein HDU67_009726 [Dinochytrium kinnereticum]|nr:hypothetical protein HDU67_009726 [Dinochytrium kinnereticum]